MKWFGKVEYERIEAMGECKERDRKRELVNM